MSPRGFITTFAALMLCLSCAWVAAYANAIPTPIAAEYWLRGTLLVKKRLALDISDPKIIFVGGSSTLFSIDTAAISRTIGKPVINLGSHAGLPLKYHMSFAERVAKPGDTIVLVPEYGYYRETQPITTWFVTQVLSWDDEYYRTRPILERLQLIASTPVRLAIEALVAKIFKESILTAKPDRSLVDESKAIAVYEAGVASARQSAPQLRAFQYFYNNLSDHGDILNTVGTTDPKPQDYGLVAPVDVPAPVWKTLTDFRDSNEKRGVSILLAFAPIMDAEPISAHKMEVLKNLNRLAVEAERRRLTFIDSPASALFPADDFFDTSFHLNIDGRKVRSDYLAGRLLSKAGQSPSVSSTSSRQSEGAL